ncbi:Tol-Pal system protein TolB, partial [Erwinia amylovora]|uniref:TolB family protein n=1 Tax=Erwinia amylovora TaxID=552 RepID=UPI003974EA10|nr:Tol-Pal system protein TolB [Erwinia amylovora]
SHVASVTVATGNAAPVIQTLANGALRQGASFPRHTGAPSFSPDGSMLSFALSITCSLNLYVLDVGSGQIRLITDGRYNRTEPTW